MSAPLTLLEEQLTQRVAELDEMLAKSEEARFELAGRLSVARKTLKQIAGGQVKGKVRETAGLALYEIART